MILKKKKSKIHDLFINHSFSSPISNNFYPIIWIDLTNEHNDMQINVNIFLYSLTPVNMHYAHNIHFYMNNNIKFIQLL